MKAGIAYLAMTKTGSTAIEDVLAPDCDIVMSGHPGLKHMRLRRFERFVRPLLGDAPVETVSMIREPLDWLGSWFRYRQRPAIAGGAKSTSGITFEQFLRDWLCDDAPEHARVGRPSDFLAAPPNGPPIDHLFRYDEYDLFIAFLQRRFGRSINPARLNVSPSTPLDAPPDVLEEVRTRMQADYALYEGARRRARDASIERLT